MSFGSKIKIDRYQRSRVKYCDAGLNFPKINGNVVGGGTVVSGISFSNPSLRGKNFTIDTEDDTFTVEDLFEVEIVDFVHRCGGQKVLAPCFEPGGRLFVRGRSSAEQCGGEPDTTDNGIVELDPETGAYIGSYFDLPSGSTSTDAFEIDKSGKMYAAMNNGSGVHIYDLDFNHIEDVLLTNDAFRVTDFGVNERGGMVIGGFGTDLIEYISTDRQDRFFIDPENFTGSPSQWSLIRITNDTIYVQATNDYLHAIDINDQSVRWRSFQFGLRAMAIDFEGYIVVGRGTGTGGRMRKIDPSDGSTIWDVEVTSSLGNSPDITQVGVLSLDYYAAVAGVLGRLHLVKKDGTVLDGQVTLGRGFAGFHPFQNDRIQNYDV